MGRKRGRPRKDSSKNIVRTIRLDENTDEYLKEIAMDLDLTISETIRYLIREEYFRHYF